MSIVTVHGVFTVAWIRIILAQTEGTKLQETPLPANRLKRSRHVNMLRKPGRTWDGTDATFDLVLQFSAPVFPGTSWLHRKHDLQHASSKHASRVSHSCVLHIWRPPSTKIPVWVIHVGHCGTLRVSRSWHCQQRRLQALKTSKESLTQATRPTESQQDEKGRAAEQSGLLDTDPACFAWRRARRRRLPTWELPKLRASLPRPWNLPTSGPKK